MLPYPISSDETESSSFKTWMLSLTNEKFMLLIVYIKFVNNGYKDKNFITVVFFFQFSYSHCLI